MVVCKFFLQGNCRFGQNCRNEHPASVGGSSQNQNRFGALSGSNANSSNRVGSASNSDVSAIIRDVPQDLDGGKARPKWIFSSYAPTKTSPASLMSENEYSPEEIRWRYYQAASAGQGNSADQEAMQMFSKIEQDYQNVLNNVNNVPKFMDEAEKKRPNRLDLSNVQAFDGRKSREDFEKTFSGTQNTPFGANKSPFGVGAASSTGAFGQTQNANVNPFSKPATSTFGQPAGPSAFGQPAFGQSGFGNSNSGAATGQTATPSFGQSTTPAFGQSAFGKPSLGGSTPSFGTPSFGSTGFGQGAQKNPFAAPSASTDFGQAASSTFGQPAQSTATFGQPSQATSAFGQPSQTTSPFGQASKPTGAFGQPTQATSTFGQPSQPTSAFGQPSQPQSAFGQPSQPQSMFGQPSQTTSTFGQPSQAQSAFGKPSQPAPAFGQAQQPTSTFGQGAQSTSTFGQASQPSNPFGKPAFGQSSQPASPFSQPAKPAAGFGTAFGQPAQPAGTGFGQTEAAFGGSTTAGETQTPKPSQTPPSNPFDRRPSGAAAAGDPSLDALNPPNPLTGKPSAPLHVTQSLPPRPPQTDLGGRLTSYRGQRTTYVAQPDKYIDGNAVRQESILCYTRPDTREPEKIWHPNAGNDPALIALGNELKKFDFQAAEKEYTDSVKDEYRHLYQTGGFKDGKLPLVPPVREWVAYDF